jgi:aerobic carbon-monoxide dehydrogenase small subunit
VKPIELTVNGQLVRAEVAPRTHLADFLREHLLLTGTHIGCEHGICGACTVEINGEIARSCITYAVACDGARVRTIESFDEDTLMTRLRQAFAEEHALQCGYCTPGMLIAARDLIRRKGGLDKIKIRAEMSGNLCRCTGYMGIVRAIEAVMALRDSFGLPSAPATDRWLGPPPGPRTSELSRAEQSPVAQKGEAGSAAGQLTSTREPGKRPIKVDVGAPQDENGETKLIQSFVLEHPREAVWRVMSVPEEVAACLPGAVLEGPVEGGEFKGRMQVALGPIKVRFSGKGRISRFDSEYRQVVIATGGDRMTGSNVSGSLAFELQPTTGPAGANATRVDVVVRYALTGLLAQFGRSNLVRDLVTRLGETFAESLDARLSTPDGARSAPATLGTASLIWRSLITRARSIVSSQLGRRPE